jgi:hypothetical protein
MNMNQTDAVIRLSTGIAFAAQQTSPLLVKCKTSIVDKSAPLLLQLPTKERTPRQADATNNTSLNNTSDAVVMLSGGVP